LFLLFGLAGIAAQRQEASRKLVAAVEAEKQAARDEIVRRQFQTSLIAAAPAKAVEWRAALRRISSDIASIKTTDSLHKKRDELTMLRGQAKTWLGQLDTKPADAVAAESEIASRSSQVQAMADFVDGVSAFDEALRDAKALIAKRSWLDADQVLDGALKRVEVLKTADASFRTLVAAGFDPDRKKAEVVAAKASIAGAVARLKRQQAAAEAAQKKREVAEEEAKAEAQAYLALCGDSPVISSWDGEMIGLASTIRESAHDPDSIDVSKCTQPILTKENCWVSACNVRGKNAFGGLILQRQVWSYSKALGFRSGG
jgi:hypothetical protein